MPDATNDNALTDEQLAEIRARVDGDSCPCARAHQLADELGITRAQLGRAFNQLHIKVKHCQLGCFE